MPPVSNSWITPLLFGVMCGAALVAAWRKRVRRSAWTACPESGRPAHVDVEAGRVVGCSQWPAHQHCEAPCRDAALRGGSPVETIVERWYSGECCALCHRPLSRMTRPSDPLALLAPDGTTDDLRDVEHLAAALAEFEPVCWDCHAERSFRQFYGEIRAKRGPSNTERS